MRAATLLLMLLSIQGVAAAPTLHAVAADLPGPGPADEAFALTTTARTDLTGHWVTDGEGTWVAPDGTWLNAGEVLWVTGNQTAWSAHGGATAIEWTDSQLLLGNAGDSLTLHGPDGAILDEVHWGDQGPLPRASPGAVWLQRDDSWVTPRIHKVGESNIAASQWTVDAVTAYAAPDAAFDVLAALIDNASERLVLHVYAFGHAALADLLVSAAERGVSVEVLLDGRVVGADSWDRARTQWLVHRLASAGASVWESNGGRYAHHHLKVLVADGNVVVQSENWVDTGVPTTGTAGNRGWGIVLHDDALANWFATWLAEDRLAWDVEPATSSSIQPAFFAPLAGPYEPVPAQRFEGPIAVTPIIGPEHTAWTDPITAAVEAAQHRVWTQQLRMDATESNALGWSRPDRWSTAVEDAAGRGVDTRIHLAAPFGSDDQRHPDLLESWRGTAIEAQLWDHLTLATLHNKGWVIDDAVVIGSLNGNHHSRSANREVSVMVHDARVADHYAALFLADERDQTRGIPAAPLPTLLAIITVGIAIGRSCCRSSPSLQSPSSLPRLSSR